MELFNAIVGRTSQLRALVSLAAKQHIYTVCERDGEIWFPIDQTYFNHLFACIQDPGAKLRTRFKVGYEDPNVFAEHYDYDLRAAVAHVLGTVQPDIIPCNIGKTPMLRFTSDISARMATNVESHARYRFTRSLDIWLNNMFRFMMSPSEYDADQRKSMKSYMQEFTEKPCQFQFAETYVAFKRRADGIAALDVEDGLDCDDDGRLTTGKHASALDIGDLLYAMWEMRHYSEMAELNSGRPMKTISVIPQCTFKANFMNIDTSALAFLRALLETQGGWDASTASTVDPAKRVTLSETKVKSESLTTKSLRWVTGDHQEDTWNYFFNMSKLRKLRKTTPFAWRISTNGVGVTVDMEPLRPLVPHTKKRKAVTRGTTPLPAHLRIGFHAEAMLFEGHAGYDNHLHFISIDPGIRSVATAFGISRNKCVFDLHQRRYRHESGINNIPGRKRMETREAATLGVDVRTLRKGKRAHRQQGKSKRSAPTTAAPILHRKSVHPDQFDLYLVQLRDAWTRLWPRWTRNGQLQGLLKGARRTRLRRAAKRRQFMDKTMDRFKKAVAIPDRKAVILFGRGGETGSFTRCRGGAKGPVLGLKRRIAKEFPVICCSEFRTSKLCFECGHVLAHPVRFNDRIQRRVPVNGVSFCQNTEHRYRILNRDVDGARKIGLRFLMQLNGEALGPWSYSVKCNDLDPDESWTGMRDFAKNMFFPGSPPNGRRARPVNAVPMDGALRTRDAAIRPSKRGRFAAE